jgi:hypothetical protein
VPRPWFSTQPVDQAFFDTAPFRLREAFEIPRPAAQVWLDLIADNPLSWCRIIQRITWTSPRPFGVGTTRTARTIGSAMVINERFFRWEEGSRQSFFVLEASVPFFRRFAEDYLVEATSETSCRFTWTIAIEPRPAARIANPPTDYYSGRYSPTPASTTVCAEATRRHPIPLAPTRAHHRRPGRTARCSSAQPSVRFFLRQTVQIWW